MNQMQVKIETLNHIVSPKDSTLSTIYSTKFNGCTLDKRIR